MGEAVGDRPIVLINPRLEDLPSAGDVMSIRGRQERIDYAKKFEDIWHFRLLYCKPDLYPIYGSLRKTFSGDWELYELDGIKQFEEYKLLGRYSTEPNGREITRKIMPR